MTIRPANVIDRLTGIAGLPFVTSPWAVSDMSEARCLDIGIPKSEVVK
jgi:hypothetical protein